MESFDQQEYQTRVQELECENLQLQKELAVKSVISEISQMDVEEDNPNCIYERIFLLLTEIMDVDNFYIVLQENNLIRIPYMTDQNDQIDPEQLKEENNPKLRNSLTGYALSKSSTLVLSQTDIDRLNREHKIEVIGSIPKQWLFLPFHGDSISGGIVVQSYAKEDSYSYNDMSILAYVTMHVGHFLSAHQARKQVQDQLEKLKAAQNQLVHSEKMASVGQLAAGVAHEINNPLGYVNSNLNSLREYIEDFGLFVKDVNNLTKSDETEQAAIPLEKINKSIQELNLKHDVEFMLSDTGEIIDECLFGMNKVKKIIQSLKNFSHAGEDKKELTDINACIKEAIIIVWNELKYHCELDTHYGEIPQTFCYPNQLNQIFMNLLINAGHAIKDIANFTDTARIIEHHYEYMDGSGAPDALAMEEIPIGCKVLGIVKDYYLLQAGKFDGIQHKPEQAREYLEAHKQKLYDPELVNLFMDLAKSNETETKELDELKLSTMTLQPGMILSRDCSNGKGLLLINKDKALTEESIKRLIAFEKVYDIPLEVFVKN